jgi:CIC family chloride channel protein
MAAFFAATVRAPLTGIALAVEMTGNFDQVLPLILTCVAAGLAAQALGGRPIYELLLERAQRRAPRRES